MTLIRNQFWRYLTEVVVLILMYVGVAKVAPISTEGNDLISATGLSAGIVVAVIAFVLAAIGTKRNSSEDLSRSSQAQYRDIFENAIAGIYQATPDRRYIIANPALARIYGYRSPEELITNLTNIPHQLYVDPQRCAELTRQLGEQGVVLAFEAQVYRQDGTVIWTLENVRAVRDASGTLLYYEGTVIDITERKQVQEALHQESQHLGNWIEERTAALRDTNRQLLGEVVERYRDKRALRESERRFRAIFDGAFQFLGLLSPDGTVLEANQAVLNFAGIQATDVVGRPFWEVRLWTISTQTQEQLKNAIAAARQGEFVRYEVDVLSAGDAVATIDFSLKPVRDESGQVVLLIPEGHDITERKRAEEKLRASQQRLSLLVRQSQVFAEITLKIRQSLQLEEILQTTVTEVQRILQVDRVLLFQLAADGSGTVVTETVVPEYPAILGEKIDDPCFGSSYLQKYRQGRISAVDDLQKANVKACHVEMLQRFGVRANLVVPILQRETLWGLLIAHQCSEPRHWQNFEIELLRQLADQVGIALAQSQLLKQEIATTQQLTEQNLHLERTKQEAEAANRAKSEFLANMSHELRTPLNGILGYAQILKREPHLSAKQLQGLDIIHQCGEHLLTLLNDILDLSKIEAQKMELHLSDFRFPHFLQGIVEIFRIRAEQKNIPFNYQPLSPLPCCVRGDEKRLRQVLINLLGNAIKFTDTGSVTFKVGYLDRWESGRVGEWESGRVGEFQSLTPSACRKMRFIIEDTGIGIAPEQLAEIFLPFHQLGESYRQVEGTGLGLAISRRLVQLMGSELNVKSTLDQGSVFWLDLDLPEVSVCSGVSQVNQRAIRGFRGPRRKILVVDDKWENRSILVNLLSPLGFEVIEAADGQDALNQALEWEPDAVLLDLVMPRMNGLEVARQIRRLPKLKHIVLLATSASVFDYNQQECLEAGCNGFIPQPLQADTLFQQLQVHLRLEWIYEPQEKFFPASGIENSSFASHLASTPDAVASPQTSLIAPPPSEIATLYELAMMGDIGGIIKQAKRLEQLDQRFVPFAHQLRQLAEGFQEKQIMEFVKKYKAVEQ